MNCLDCFSHLELGVLLFVTQRISADPNVIFLFLTFIYLFIYFWLRWVFVAARGLSLVAASGGLLFVAEHGL